MVWKFNSAAAEVKHAERLTRGDTFADAPVLTDVLIPAPGNAAPVPRPLPTPEPVPAHKVEPSFQAAALPVKLSLAPAVSPAPIRSEPSFATVLPTPTSLHERSEPSLTIKIDELAPVLSSCDAAASARGASLLPEPPAYVEVDVASFPSSDLSWDIPPFEGTPDELPDLRPAPPAPIEHPGLQFRSQNTFGHALRLPAEDERQVLWLEQRRDRGFDDTELWGLDDAFARFILPRLKALRQQKLEAPSKRMELTQWYSLLDKMIRAFELLLPEGGGAWSRGTLTDRERAQVQEGLDLFRQYYFSLNW